MRCVSYTRTTSCKSSESIPTDIIQQQNEQIQKYIQSHGWKLVAKYSDRKRDDNENTAFEEMTMDGISRKFDMVVVNSIDRCGKYISCAEDVLAKTFFPAGIHFSVVQDDFCSIEKSREEIDEYFRKEKIAVQIKSMREFAVREQIEGYYNVHDEKYGYILSEDRKELLVEEEAATIVREVFQMLLEGVSVKKIADIMNERGVESPMVHNARVGHKHWPHYENKWSEGSLRRILDCTAYDGYWKKTINGKLCTIPITPILEKGVFDKAKEIVKNNGDTVIRKLCNNDPENITAKTVFEAAVLQDEIAMHLIDQAAKYIGIALATAINMLDPDTIYLCGGMMKNGDDFLNRIKKYTRERQMHLAGRHVAIRPGSKDELNVAKGATLMIQDSGWEFEALSFLY